MVCGRDTELRKTQVARAILKPYYVFFYFFQVFTQGREWCDETNKADKSNKDFC